MKEITVEELATAIKNNSEIVVVDIREDYEFNVGHLKCNLLHIPMAEVEERRNEIDPKSTVYLMCKSGKRAAAMANYLCSNYDFPNLGYVLGGIEAYANEIDASIAY